MKISQPLTEKSIFCCTQINLSFQLAVTATRHKLDIHVSLQEAPADIQEDVQGEHHQQAEAPCEGLLVGGYEVQALAGPLRCQDVLKEEEVDESFLPLLK